MSDIRFGENYMGWYYLKFMLFFKIFKVYYSFDILFFLVLNVYV